MNNNAFHRHPSVIAARKQYRADLKAGMDEREAWETADAVYAIIRRELQQQEREEK